MRTIKQLINRKESVYIILKNKAICYRFMSDAEREDITYADKTTATAREMADIMALSKEGYLCFLGRAGHMKYHSRRETSTRIDYERYVDGEEDYFYKNLVE